VIQDLVDLVRQNGARIASYLHDRKVVTMAASLPEKFHLLGDATVADVVVGTVDTILESIKYLPAIDLLVIDEAQHAPTPTYLKCINKSRAVNPALRILGATATPERPEFCRPRMRLRRRGRRRHYAQGAYRGGLARAAGRAPGTTSHFQSVSRKTGLTL
jgi:hypothetical protein